MQVVLVTSFINANSGIYNSSDRMIQTLKTLFTLNENIDDIDCHLIDTSGLSIEQIKTLEPYCTVHNKPDISNMDKTFGELQMLRYFISIYDFSKVTHFHKISGRYYLNDNYSMNINKDYIFLKNDTSWDGNGVIETRYYKMPVDNINVYKGVIDYIIYNRPNGDIEHLFYAYKALPLDMSVDIIGLSGYLAPSGDKIDE